jgi:hypothetical protein
MHRRVTQLAQLFIIEAVKEVEWSVRCPRSDCRLGTIGRTETVRIRFSVRNRAPVIPPEQCSDAAPQTEQPFDYWRGRRHSRDEDGTQVLDRALGAATGEPDRPHVLQRDVMEQGVDAKRARAKFTGIDTHVAGCCPLTV